MKDEDTINRIKNHMECSYEIAKASYEEANKDYNLALEIAKRKMGLAYAGGGATGTYIQDNSKLKHITQYKNGILVDDKFYDYEEDDNIKLKEMIEKGEFSAELLGVEGDTAEVTYTEKLDEVYEDPNLKKVNEEKRKNMFVGEGRKLGSLCGKPTKKNTMQKSIPKELCLSPNSNIVFKVVFDGDIHIVRASNEQTVKYFCEYLKAYIDYPINLVINNETLDSSYKLEKLKDQIVTISKKN